MAREGTRAIGGQLIALRLPWAIAEPAGQTESLCAAVHYINLALEAFKTKRAFKQMREHAMAKRFDWSRPTHRYADLYARALAA